MTESHLPGPEATAGRREWTALGVLLLPVLLVSMDLTVLFFAMPSITADLQPSSTQQLWMVDIYGFVLAGVLITMGALGDRIGRRRLLLIGAVAFGAGSALASYAGTPELLIAARALQGIGGATLMPSTLALIRNIFRDQAQRRTAVAVWSTGMAAGAALGPVISGLLLSQFWWGSIFLVNIPVMVLLLVVGPILLPEFRAPAAGRFDLLGAVLSLVAVLPIVYGFKRIAVDGPGVLPVGGIAVGLVFGALFVRRQRTSPDPLIDLEVLRAGVTRASVVTNMLASFVLVGFALFSTQYMQSVLGMSALKSALWTLPGTVAVGVSVPLATALVRRVRPAYIICGGFLIAAVALLAMTRLPDRDGLALLLIAITAVAFGLAPVLALVTELVVGTADPARAGSTSALLQTAQEFGGALGVAVLGSIGAAVYTHSASLDAPADVPADLLGPARETVGGALAVAGRLPQAAADTLAGAARAAFAEEVHAAALAGGAVMVLAGAFVLATLRSVRNDAHQEQRTAGSAAGTTVDPAAARTVLPAAES
ncbi:MFS transporter [Kitasatospora sp. NPDC057223]|uniref:MFS transporter n=1 Tax=Kitasatospora sp. NPDC057223 TaxID=3346055 RepID=UPI0036390E3E